MHERSLSNLSKILIILIAIIAVLVGKDIISDKPQG
jgi:hypothetical protein